MNKRLSDLNNGEVEDIQKKIYNAIVDILDNNKVVILNNDKDLFSAILDDIKIAI